MQVLKFGNNFLKLSEGIMGYAPPIPIPPFDASGGFDFSAFTMEVDSDGNYWFGGTFTSYAGQTATRIVKTNPSGQIIDIGSPSFNNTVNTIKEIDGNIYVGGQFTSYSGITVGPLIKIDKSGNFISDSSADLWTGTKVVNYISELSDGSIGVCGSFSGYDSANCGGFTILTPDFVRDPAFNNTGGGANQPVNHMEEDSNGAIRIAGNFWQWNGGSTDNRLMRVLRNGNRDTSFAAAPSWNAVVNGSFEGPDGSIYVCHSGTFASAPGNKQYFARLNQSGVLDTTFPGETPSSATYEMFFDENLQGYVCGSFHQWGATVPSGLVRIDISTGDHDSTFNTGEEGFYPSGTQGPIVLLESGNIMVLGGGTYNEVDYGGIVEITPSGAPVS